MAALAATETIERQAFGAWFDAFRTAELPDVDWSLVPVGDAVCSVSATEPSILVNRVFGLGSEDRPTLEQLIEIRELYLEAGIFRFFLHLPPEVSGPEVQALLGEAGYQRHRGWMKFSRRPGDVPAASTDLTVRRIFAEDAERFAGIVVPAFGLASTSTPVVATLADAGGWWLYMSFAGDEPAGTGALFMADGIGYLDWAATAPAFRRRGSQSAILGMALKDAFATGCERVVTMTGEAVPGDEQVSYGNILKAGFEEDYLRENWIPRGS
jgi:GNAT superfamily N-acetyltransferase